jgi:glycosyltransferase involved in cell wall biosynthesis
MRPDVVHAHSSIAGAWVRAFIKGPRIVYSPHCFAFERRDTPGLIRASYLAAEYILARRPQVVAVVSEREAALARRLRTRAGVVYVPHSVPGRQDFAPADRVADDLPQDIAPVPSRLTVVTAGRIGPQKDPDYLLRVKAKVSEALNLDWLWVGEGDRQAHEKLRMGGVRVTGWLSRELALAVMSRASVYVHTAAWEGAPVVVAEAASLNVPVIARAIPATVSELPTAMLAATEEDMARRITDVVSAARSRRSVLDAGRRYAMTQTVERQRVALRRLYDETG